MERVDDDNIGFVNTSQGPVKRGVTCQLGHHQQPYTADWGQGGHSPAKAGNYKLPVLFLGTDETCIIYDVAGGLRMLLFASI